MIPSALYDRITALMPVATVEAMILKDSSLLFLRRKNDPAGGEWWFPGGRIMKGETFEETLFREIKEETHLDFEVVKMVGVYSRVFPERHDITVVFLCKCFSDKVILNNEHSEYKFFNEVPSETNPYLLKAIEDSGWRQSAQTERAHAEKRGSE